MSIIGKFPSHLLEKRKRYYEPQIRQSAMNLLNPNNQNLLQYYLKFFFYIIVSGDSNFKLQIQACLHFIYSRLSEVNRHDKASRKFGTLRDGSRFPERAFKRELLPHPGGPSRRVILQKFKLIFTSAKRLEI